MALTKSTIAEAIQHEAGLPKNNATETAESILEIIKWILASGEEA